MSLLEGLAQWPGALLLQRSGTAYLLVSATHILGIGRPDPAMRIVAPVLLRTAQGGLALALLAGFWLFTVKPAHYTVNPAAWVKAALLVLALVNVVFQHRDLRRTEALSGAVAPRAVRLRAILSMVLWLGVLVSGRWICFV